MASAAPAPLTPTLVRPCCRADLRALEFSGEFTHHRRVIERAFERHERGEVLMLVAAAGDAVVGQAWVDFAKTPGAGVIWAVRVVPALRTRGIGSLLMAAAERAIAARGLALAEVAVERTNPRARALYERLGYRHVRDEVERFDIETLDGGVVAAVSDLHVLHKAIEAASNP